MSKPRNNQHNRYPEAKTPPEVASRLAIIGQAKSNVAAAVVIERHQDALQKPAIPLFTNRMAQYIAGHEVVADNVAVAPARNNAPAQTMDKMEVTDKPSSRIDLNEEQNPDLQVFDAMVSDQLKEEPEAATEPEEAPQAPAPNVVELERRAKELAKGIGENDADLQKAA